ncbi:MAG: hypothetical protein IKN81_03505 [Oscillospiraceae bacterium]|nr:hypothetical protein [Oscillospiraceae bacterium]
MASITHQVKQMRYDLRKQYAKEQTDRDGMSLPTKNITTGTRKQYLNAAVKFCKWAKKAYGCRTTNECQAYIQEYANYLVTSGKSAATIHTYMAGICRSFGLHLDDYTIPTRRISEITRSRGKKAVDSRTDAKPEVSPRLYAFAAIIGIRRSEYGDLKGGNLVRDESGYSCVEVLNGKGGKYQLQRILGEDVDAVKAFFSEVNADNYLFSRDELDNKLDLHRLRAEQAQRAYQHYLQRIEDEGRENLTNEIKLRWNKYNHKKRWSPRVVHGTYSLRGKNREFALQHGLPIAYDRLALMAVSVFHLSHWRCNVTVCNYLLAVND